MNACFVWFVRSGPFSGDFAGQRRQLASDAATPGQ